MGEQQVQDAAPAAFVAQQPVTGVRRLLQACPRQPDQVRIARDPWRASSSAVAAASPIDSARKP